MDGQMTIFDLIKTVPSEWERFSDEFCKKKAGFLRFDNEGKVTNDKDFPVVAACCFTPRNIKESWDNWQPCTFENCPLRNPQRVTELIKERKYDEPN